MSQTAHTDLLYDFEIACFAVAHEQSGPTEKAEWQATKARITAALSALPSQGGVKVKELEWVSETGWGIGPSYKAVGGNIGYRIYDNLSDSKKRYKVTTLGFNSSAPPIALTSTLEAAIAAAQADYETRIMSAITLQGEPVAMACNGCGSTKSIEDIRATGAIACCPERKMVPASELIRELWSKSYAHQPVTAGWELVPTAAIEWLMGSGPDPSGHHFGEFPDDVHPKGAYWWRSYFRRMIDDARAALKSEGCK